MISEKKTITKDIGLDHDEIQLAKKIFVKLLDFEDVETIVEMENLMEDAIDLAIEFNTRIRNRKVLVLTED